MLKILIVKNEEDIVKMTHFNSKGEKRNSFKKEENEAPTYSLAEFLASPEILSYNKFLNLLSNDYPQINKFITKNNFFSIPLLINEKEYVYVLNKHETLDEHLFDSINFDLFVGSWFVDNKIPFDLFLKIIKNNNNKNISFKSFGDLFSDLLKNNTSVSTQTIIKTSFYNNCMQNFFYHKEERYLDYVGMNIDDYSHFLDYIKSVHKDNRDNSYYPLEQLKKEVAAWDEKNKRRGKYLVETEKDKLFIGDVDNYKLFKLLTPEAKDREGSLMDHCVGGGAFDKSDIYSIRDEGNNPFCTILLDGNIAHQIKGKKNEAIELKYHKALVESLVLLNVREIDSSEYELIGLVDLEGDLGNLIYSCIISEKLKLKKKVAFFNSSFDLKKLEKIIKENANDDLDDILFQFEELSDLILKMSGYSYSLSLNKKINLIEKSITFGNSRLFEKLTKDFTSEVDFIEFFDKNNIRHPMITALQENQEILLQFLIENMPYLASYNETYLKNDVNYDIYSYPIGHALDSVHLMTILQLYPDAVFLEKADVHLFCAPKNVILKACKLNPKLLEGKSGSGDRMFISLFLDENYIDLFLDLAKINSKALENTQIWNFITNRLVGVSVVKRIKYILDILKINPDLINETEKSFVSLLYLVPEKRMVDFVNLFIDHYPKILNHKDITERSLTNWLLSLDTNDDIVGLLEKIKKIDINYIIKENITMFFGKIMSIESGKKFCLSLIKERPELFVSETQTNEYLIHYMVHENKIDFEPFFENIYFKKSLSLRDRFGCYPVFYAKDSNIVLNLLKIDSSMLNHKDNSGNTLIHHFISNKLNDLAISLLNKNKKIIDHKNRNEQDLFYFCIAYDNLEVFEEILKVNPKKIKESYGDYNVLHAAITNRALKITKYIIENYKFLIKSVKTKDPITQKNEVLDLEFLAKGHIEMLSLLQNLK